MDFHEDVDLATKEHDSTITEIIAPLLKRSVHSSDSFRASGNLSMPKNDPYTHIKSSIFKEHDIDNFSLKERIKQKYEKHKEPANYSDRRYSDYLRFCFENPETPTIEMDTVYNIPRGPLLHTFLFEKTAFIIIFSMK